VDKTMQFFELGKGRFAQQVQEAFVKAHKVAFETGEKVPVVVKLNIDPPDPQSPDYGNISWEVDIRIPSRKSIKHITRLSGGLPVSDGTDIAALLQVEMDLGTVNG